MIQYTPTSLSLDFINNLAVVNGEDYALNKNQTPARPNAFDNLITFSRGSLGTVTDSTGRVTYAPNNLFRYSEQLDNAAWTLNAATIIANTTTAPDGNLTADTLLATAGTGTIPRFSDVSLTLLGYGTNYIASVYVKPNTYNFVQIYINNQGTEWCNFTLTGAGTAVSNGSSVANIQALANGWYRISMQYTAGVSNDRRPFFMLAASGTATRAQTWNPAGYESVYFWGAQLEAVTYQTTPRTYIATTTAAYYGPRFDYDPLTLVPKGMLIEEARTNNFTYSQLLNNAYWTRLGMTITEDQITAPDGTLTADKCEVTSNEREFSGPNQIAIFPIGSTAAWSVYAKKGNVSTWPFRVSTIGTAIVAYGATFNFDTGTFSGVTSGLTASAVSVGSGWYRLTFVFTVPAAATSVKIQWRTYVNSTSGVGDFAYFWGAQAETGSFATSYIPTVASTVTRSADNVSMTGTNFSSWYNKAQGTWTSNADTNAPSGSARAIIGGSAGNRASLYVHSLVGGIAIFDGANLNLTSNGITVGAAFKAAASYGQGGLSAVLSGSTVATSSLYTSSFASDTSITIGNWMGGGYLNGHVRSLNFYPIKLSDAVLQQLTT